MKQYVVDAFADKIFSGNQAAVCILENRLSDELMRNIARENNFSETAFAIKDSTDYQLRWFTPCGEIDLCGHATLGTAYVIKHFYDTECTDILFHTMSGELNVNICGDIFEMNFPAYSLNQVPVTDKMTAAIGVRPIEAYLDRDLMLVLNSEEDVRNVCIDQQLLKELDGLGVAVTAAGKQYDCVSRVFASELSVPEDPVTGSTHCMIAPYWAKKLHKDKITAYQASERAGTLYCELQGDRVKISGRAVLYSVSDILSDVGL